MPPKTVRSIKLSKKFQRISQFIKRGPKRFSLIDVRGINKKREYSDGDRGSVSSEPRNKFVIASSLNLPYDLYADNFAHEAANEDSPHAHTSSQPEPESIRDDEDANTNTSQSSQWSMLMDSIKKISENSTEKLVELRNEFMSERETVPQANTSTPEASKVHTQNWTPTRTTQPPNTLLFTPHTPIAQFSNHSFTFPTPSNQNASPKFTPQSLQNKSSIHLFPLTTHTAQDSNSTFIQQAQSSRHLSTLSTPTAHTAQNPNVRLTPQTPLAQPLNHSALFQTPTA
ncbi:hypothetical protein QAD02_020501 [Eretmocerus hayati]|uniref:Uncharacterized protein n=1 Tax=Eretmocerus hayati TaxID=131215 RepID=A0ACC2PNL9_9HYME|nr:hypothetical protein QAD02_020501 [Eretmocerus hayati]